FTTDYPDAELVKLEQNYRSSQNVVGAALGIIRHASERQPKELWTDNDAGDPVRIVHSANERDEAAFVVGGVKKSIEDGISPREIAIFYRVHAQSRVLEEVMRQANIPYQIVGGTKFFDRAEIKDVLSYLRVAANPASDVDLLRIINKPPRKIGKTTIGRLTELASQRGGSLFASIEPLCQTDRLGSAAKKNLRAFKKLMDDLVRQAATGGPKDVADAVIADSGYVDYLKKQDNAEADARLDNLDELLGSIAEYEEEASYADEPATVADYLTRVSLLAGADTMADVERVAMMTVHAAKGLEFDVVFVTGLEEKLFPLRGQQPGEEEELEEERRLAYVAVTRARQQLYLVHTNTRTIYGQMRYNQPARFLDQIPPAHQERIATPALHDLSRQFTRTGSVSHRDHIRAGIGRDESRQNALGRRRSLQPDVSRPRVPARKAGERYVERDADVEYDDDFDSLDRFSARVGMNVRHPKFGVGQVQQIAGGGDPVCVVRFDGWGDKRIKLSFLSPA
ncbi:MAG: 3'-5' exonuclease, partial [Myxococcota bacterium]